MNEVGQPDDSVTETGSVLRTTETAGSEATIFIQPMRYVEFEFEDGRGARIVRLTVEDARRVAAQLLSAADDLDAGRGST